ncbi:MAG: radical SAM protein [Peptococcaceae bacterium]|jgi:uncharacterized protein|nr:radical SAM protein [Peptococcaceae bacterium]
MLGSYEIDYEGRKYFGNVSLREHHIFGYNDNLYLVDVERMAAQPVSPRLAASIGRIASAPGTLVPASVMEELRGIGLVFGEEKEETPMAPPESKQGAVPEKAGYPVANIALFLAQECNMACVYCYGNGGEYAGGGMMSEETAFRSVDWLVENSGSVKNIGISFFGGEPFLNFPLMKKVVSYAKKKAGEKDKRITFGVTTNASLLTEEAISFLKDEKIYPLISFDGPAEYQDSQRPFKDGSGSYDRIVNNVRKLREVIPHLTARATVTDGADPFRIKEGMEAAGFTTCILTPVSPVILNAPSSGMPPDGSGERMLERMLAFHRAETEQLLTAIRERSIDKDNLPAYLSSIGDIALGRKRYYACGVGKGMAGISVNGDIYPCHRFAGQEDARLGNIADYRTGNLNDYHRAVVNHLPECRKCCARHYCGGGCFYDNKARTGDMHQPDPLRCREVKGMIEGLIHVYCQLDEADKEYVKEMIKGLSPDEWLLDPPQLKPV